MKWKVIVIINVFWISTGFFGCLQEDIQFKTTESGRLIDYVDTRVATGGLVSASGHTSPAVTTPFGMVKPGPDTATMGIITSSSGYHYGDTELVGFSQTRYFGTGSSEGGVLRLIPNNETIVSFKEKDQIVHLFNHKNEVAEPGYYKVITQNSKIQTEVTSTPRVGVYRFQFEPEKSKNIIVDVTSKLDGNKEYKESLVKIDSKKRLILGSTHLVGDFSSRYKGIKVYFAIHLNQDFEFSMLVPELTYRKQEVKVDQIPLALNLVFPESSTPVEARVALSYTSSQKALRNLEVEVGNRSFESIKDENQNLWEKKLAKIQIEASKENKHIFYASLYRSYLMPSLYSDVGDAINGQEFSFQGFDSKTHVAQNFDYYSDLSLWDTFRTVHPLYNLIDQKPQLDMIKSLLHMGEVGGTLPRWPSGAGYSGSMLGHPAAILITESYLKGLRGFDSRKALKIMVKSTSKKEKTLDRFGERVDEFGKEFMDEYLQYGYCPLETEGSVSRTLEYVYADYSVYRLALALGEGDITDQYYERSQNYKNLWDGERALFIPRDRNGNFLDEVSLTDTSYTQTTQTGRAFVEGGAKHWRWYLPHDPESLVALYGDRMVPELNSFFEQSSDQIGVMYPGVNYWHGNEPDIHASYLFSFAGRPDLSQKWVHWIMQNKYKASAQGLDGDDDAGTLSAWYVFSALGFYPLAGTERYVIGSPVVSQAKVQLESLNGLVHLDIKVHNFDAKNIYVQKVILNGEPLSEPSFNHQDIAAGGELEFFMSSTPSQETFKGGQ